MPSSKKPGRKTTPGRLYKNNRLKQAEKKAEQQIADSMNYIKTIFEASPIGIVTYKESGEVISANPAAATIVGATIEQVRKQNFRKLKSWEQSGLLEAASAALASNEERRIEVHDVSSFGKESWFVAHFVPFTHQGRKELLALLTDVTERKFAEEQLIKTCERLDLATSAAHLGIWDWDIRKNELVWDDRMYELYGIKREDFCGAYEAWLAGIHPDDRDASNEVSQQAQRGEREYDTEFRVVWPDGTIRHLKAHGLIIRDPSGKPLRMTGINYDITERKRAEEALKLSEAKYRSICENINDALYMHDLEGNIFDVNENACRMLGYTREELVGANLSKIDSSENAKLIKNRIRSVASTGGMLFEGEHIAKNGKRIPIQVSSKIVSADGKGVVYGLVRDVTEMKAYDEKLRTMQKLDSLGVLAGGIAHDFNNLLAGIFGNIDLARSVSKDPRVTGHLEATLATMGRARALTLQLLTFAKGGSPVKKATPLVPFLQDAAHFALSGSNISCRFFLAGDLRPCHIDKNQIGQVIDNIVINAQQAMPNGGAIEIKAENRAFGEKEHPPLAEGDYVKVSIKDSGIGIPKDIIPRIFDPFYTTKTKGHGLGLATCYSIINRHGGCIDVESEPGRGSAFHVYLPASAEAVEANGAAIVKHEGSGTIIVVDDEEILRITVRKMLESMGYAVVCKSDGKEAIDFFINETKANRRCAAMIFDLTIPGGMGGKEAIEAVRELDKEIPVFVASGYADNCVMMHPDDYGFTASISKPFTIAELSEMLSKHVKS